MSYILFNEYSNIIVFLEQVTNKTLLRHQSPLKCFLEETLLEGFEVSYLNFVLGFEELFVVLFDSGGIDSVTVNDMGFESFGSPLMEFGSCF